MPATHPERLTALFLTSPTFETERLFKSENASLTVNGKSFSGIVEIKHRWESNISQIEFLSKFSDGDLSFTEATITAPETRFPIKFFINSHSDDFVRGSISSPVCIGTEHKLNRVTFHLASYPDVITDKVFDDILMEYGKEIKTSWSRVSLEHGEWSIDIEPYGHIHTIRTRDFRPPYPALSGVGQIRKRDGSQFNPKHVLRVLERLRIFLSFAFADWKTPLFIVGSNSHAVRSVLRITPYDSGTKWFHSGWLDIRHGQHLTQAYPGFCDLWEKKEWQFPVRQAIKWLIDATNSTSNVEGAIAVCQIPMEMFAWNLFVGDKALVSEDNFDKLNAAERFHLLLDRCGIPVAIPAELTALTAISTQGKKTYTGPQMLTQLRNSIIHPKESNRKTITGWVTNTKVSRQDVFREALNLFTWYTTLVLLWLMDYRGEYANRLPLFAPHRLERVPWAK
jgi:hypothetical protein